MPNQIPPTERSAFTRHKFPPEIVIRAVRWYLRYGLSYRDVEELRAERGIEVDHGTIYRGVQRFTPLLIDAARPCRHDVRNLRQIHRPLAIRYRADDQHGHVLDVFVSKRRNIPAARRFFKTALLAHLGHKVGASTVWKILKDHPSTPQPIQAA